MKKKILIIIAIVLTAGMSAILLAGCASMSVKRLSADQFIRNAKASEVPGSFQWYEYIGTTEGNAYLECGHPAFIGKGNQITIYWVPLSELPNELSEQLRSGNSPWTNWNKGVSTQRVEPMSNSPIDLSKP